MGFMGRMLYYGISTKRRMSRVTIIWIRRWVVSLSVHRGAVEGGSWEDAHQMQGMMRTRCKGDLNAPRLLIYTICTSALSENMTGILRRGSYVRRRGSPLCRCIVRSTSYTDISKVLDTVGNMLDRPIMERCGIL